MFIVVAVSMYVSIYSCVAFPALMDYNTLGSVTRWTKLKTTGDGPSIRYSTGAAVYGGNLYVSHGYFYDHKNGQPRWLQDSWRLPLSRNPLNAQWTNLTTIENGPQMRYSHSLNVANISPATTVNDTLIRPNQQSDFLLLFGGHGKKRDTYSLSARNDLWKMNLKTSRWMRLGPPENRPTAPWPSERYGHASCFDRDSNILYIFGGIIEVPRPGNALMDTDGSNELWAVRILRDDVISWTLLYGNSKNSSRFGPAKMHGMSMVCYQGLLWVYGGRPIDYSETSDVWIFDTNVHDVSEKENPTALTWTLLKSFAHPTWPSPRFWHGSDIFGHHLVVYGGAVCRGSCVCLSDSWALNLKTRRWQMIDDGLSRSPGKRYKHSLVAVFPYGIFTFGGESYDPYSYYNDVWWLPLPSLLEIQNSTMENTNVGTVYDNNLVGARNNSKSNTDGIKKAYFEQLMSLTDFSFVDDDNDDKKVQVVNILSSRSIVAFMFLAVSVYYYVRHCRRSRCLRNRLFN